MPAWMVVGHVGLDAKQSCEKEFQTWHALPSHFDVTWHAAAKQQGRSEVAQLPLPINAQHDVAWLRSTIKRQDPSEKQFKVIRPEAWIQKTLCPFDALKLQLHST